jgi:ferric-dicitrate binding protein FerR (iron transport regulator)
MEDKFSINMKAALRRDSLTDEEVMQLWEHIRAEEVARRGRQRWLRVLGAAIVAVAACVAGILFLPEWLAPPVQPDPILTFVRQADTVDYSAPNTQLVLSKEKTVELKEKESTVTYDSTSINVSGAREKVKMAKEEAATYNRLIVPMGKRSTLALSDGSRVWVNAGTQVIYPVTFLGKTRELYVDGEIYISVAPDKEHPFIVKTKDADIRVTGTEFNVTAYGTEAEKRIVLVKGAVEVTNRSHLNGRSEQQFALTPGEMYRYDEQMSSVETVDVARYVSWKEGMYIFDNDRLSYILACLSRYYGEPIRWDAAAGELRCSGKLDLKGTLDEVLNGLTITAPIAYEHRSGNHSITIKATSDK